MIQCDQLPHRSGTISWHSRPPSGLDQRLLEWLHREKEFNPVHDKYTRAAFCIGDR